MDLISKLFIATLFLAFAGLLLFIYYYLVKRYTRSSQLANELHYKNNHLAELVNYLMYYNQSLTDTNHLLNQKILKQQKIEENLSAIKDADSRLHYDALTALPTRAFFLESLHKAIIHAKRRKKVLAVLLLDMDSVADKSVIKETTNRLRSALRSEDILAKLEGDEFIILLNDLGKAKFASTVADKILRACFSPSQTDKPSFSASIGIAVYPTDGESTETLLSNTTAALQAMQRNGGNGYQFYNDSLNIEGHEHIRLENALRHAIQNNELSLHYQPKLHLKRGRIAGVEALIRWTHPQLGVIHPSAFIPIAEDTNLILPLGEWALREACKANKHWQDEGYEHITISLNLSTKQFYHPTISETISQILQETGLNPDYLELEITETTVMNDITKSTDILNKIKACGVHLAIDHMGIGYTSINHLKQFPISTIKIDNSFIQGIPNNSNDLSIVNAFIGLAQNLGLLVVAEGVETAEQVEYLSHHHCDIIQGYYLSPPVSEEKIILQFKELRDNIMF